MEKPLSIPELAVFLGVSESWIEKQCAARTIPHSRVARQVRFMEHHIAQILAAGEQPVVGSSPVTSIRVRAGRAA